MRSSTKIYLLAIGTIIAAAGWTSALAEDHEERLIGRYGLSMFQSCIETPRARPPAIGFDPDTRALLQTGEGLNSVLRGVVSFNRHAGVTIQDGLLSDIFLNQLNVGDIPISSKTPVTCTGQYSRANEDVNFTLDCTAQLPGNLTVTIGTFQIEGLVGSGARTITLSSLAGNILTEGFSIGGTTVAQRQRVCLLQGTLNKLNEEQHD